MTDVLPTQMPGAPAEAFGHRFPELTVPSLPFMGACTIAVESLAAAEAALRRGGIATRRGGDALVARFPEELGLGAWVFEEKA